MKNSVMEIKSSTPSLSRKVAHRDLHKAEELLKSVNAEGDAGLVRLNTHKPMDVTVGMLRESL